MGVGFCFPGFTSGIMGTMKICYSRLELSVLPADLLDTGKFEKMILARIGAHKLIRWAIVWKEKDEVGLDLVYLKEDE